MPKQSAYYFVKALGSFDSDYERHMFLVDLIGLGRMTQLGQRLQIMDYMASGRSKIEAKVDLGASADLINQWKKELKKSKYFQRFFQSIQAKLNDRQDRHQN